MLFVLSHNHSVFCLQFTMMIVVPDQVQAFIFMCENTN